MKVDDQYVIAFTELEQGHANQRQERQVERFNRFLRGQGLQCGLSFFPGQVIQLSDIDFYFELGMDELMGLSVPGDERGSQTLMPFDDLIETFFQGR